MQIVAATSVPTATGRGQASSCSPPSALAKISRCVLSEKKRPRAYVTSRITDRDRESGSVKVGTLSRSMRATPDGISRAIVASSNMLA
jgi:hypothetical protein